MVYALMRASSCFNLNSVRAINLEKNPKVLREA